MRGVHLGGMGAEAEFIGIHQTVAVGIIGGPEARIQKVGLFPTVGKSVGVRIHVAEIDTTHHAFPFDRVGHLSADLATDEHGQVEGVARDRSIGPQQG